MLFPVLVILPGMIAIVTPGLVNKGTNARAASGPVSGVVPGILPGKLDTNGHPVLDRHGRPVPDYDLATPMMLVHFYPSGLLGLGLTALLASFMSGMAGNVTAFNTVWTYDIYQAYLKPSAPDAHYVSVGRVTTVAGIALSIGAAYLAASFNNIMDLLQLVFAFVNAPLFATFALGMFSRRTTGTGAFTGLLAGMLGACVHHGISLPQGATPGIHGGFLGVHVLYASDLGQAFWTAIVAFTVCVVVTVIVSLLTPPPPKESLQGLVYSMTPRLQVRQGTWYRQPEALAIAVLVAALVLNVWFF